jgi:ParB-like chromosome segregation protein Spo0J
MKDPKAERMLEDHLVDYVYEADIPLDQFDIDTSLRNQARIDPPLMGDVVTQYAEAIADGADFPALVGYYDGDKIILIDGNHRLNAHVKNGSETVDAYIVDAAQDVIQALTYMANATHGRPPTDEERIHHAIHLRDLGYSNREAARNVGLTEAKVSSAFALEQMTRRARRLGVHRGLNSLSRDVRLKISTIQNDNVLKGLITFLVGAKGLTRPEVATLIQEVRNAATEQTQLQTIVEFKEAKRNEQRSEGRTKYRADARRSLLPHLGYIHQQEPEAVRNATLTQEQRDGLKDHLLKAVVFCNNLMKLLVEDEAKADQDGDS